MPAPRTSLLGRCAANSLDFVVRFWPENSRRWGQAILAEIGEINEPAAAASWAMGGILLFFRALLCDFLAWLKLPAGERLSDASSPSGSKGPQFPKHSRWATAAVLLAALSLFFLPIGREARKTVSASWREFGSSNGDRQELEKLGARAEKEQDAHELAFVALNNLDKDRAVYFADRAIALNPSLAWIYVTPFVRLENPGDKERLARLKSFDPGNAVIYLAAARAEGQPRIWTLRGNNATKDKRAEALSNDSEWLEEMGNAFRAPRYDSYKVRRREITREGWDKKPYLSPSLAAVSVYLAFFPDMFEIKTYAALRIREARQAAAAGDIAKAEKIITEVTAFGERMSKENEAAEFQQWFGFDVTRLALNGLRQIYADRSRSSEAAAIASQIDDLDRKTAQLREDFPKVHKEGQQVPKTRAVLVHALSSLVVLLALATLLCLCALELSTLFSWRKTGLWRRLACRMADRGPVLFLATSVAFLLSFQPFAAALQQYRSVNSSQTELRHSSMELEMLQGMNPLSYFSKSSSDYFLWLLLTIVLSAIALVVLVRALVRHRTTPSTTH
jgi:hypothetical protein